VARPPNILKLRPLRALAGKSVLQLQGGVRDKEDGGGHDCGTPPACIQRRNVPFCFACPAGSVLPACGFAAWSGLTGTRRQWTDLLFVFPLAAVVLLVRWIFSENESGLTSGRIRASSSYHNPHHNDTPAWRQREREIEIEREREREQERREREREMEERKWSKGV